MHAYSIGLLTRLVEPMSEPELRTPIGEGQHTALWVLGHLTIALDFALRRLGETVDISDERMRACGPDSKPDAVPPAAWTKASLLAEIRERHDRVAAAIPKADPARLAQPHGLPWYDGTPIRTNADIVDYLLTAHASYHIGQVSVYRRARGYPPLF